MLSRLKQKGQLILKHLDKHGVLKGEEIIRNEAKDEGLNFLLDVVFGSQSIFTWYMGIIDDVGFVSVATDDTYLQLQADALNWDELDPTNYSFNGNTSRQNIQFDDADNGRIAADNNPTTFVVTSNGDGKSAKGIFVTSQQSVSQPSGVLWATIVFGSAKLLADGDRLVLVYEVTQARA